MQMESFKDTGLAAPERQRKALKNHTRNPHPEKQGDTLIWEQHGWGNC